MATKEYAIHKQTALFFEAGNDKELSDHIQYLWNHREVAKDIGQQALQAILKLHDKRIKIFSDLLERCSMDILKENADASQSSPNSAKKDKCVNEIINRRKNAENNS